MSIILQQPQAGRMESMKVSQLLENALALFGTNGEHWVNRLPNLNDQEYCSVTCIANVSHGENRYTAWGYLDKALLTLYGWSASAAIWNDDPARTWPQVSSLFAEAIALARQEESLDAKM